MSDKCEGVDVRKVSEDIATIDATPDGKYAIRILEHYLERAQEAWPTNQIVWNHTLKVQKKRVIELEEALEKLRGEV